MSLTSEMSRITTDFEAAQGERLAAVAGIGSALRRQSQRNKAALKRTMAAHRTATKRSLRNIFGTAAFTRGAAEEMIERFKLEREKCASDLRNQLDSYVGDLRETVGKELAHLTAARVKIAHREESVRRAQLKDLRWRVEVLLAGSVKLIQNFNRDRVRAGRLWEQHLRDAPRQRRTAMQTAGKNAPTPRKKSVRRTAKKQKHARV